MAGVSTHIDLIRAALRRLGWDQAELARRAGIGENTVTRVLHGRARAQAATLHAIAAAISESGEVEISYEQLDAGQESHFAEAPALPAMRDSMIRLVTRWMLLDPHQQDAAERLFAAVIAEFERFSRPPLTILHPPEPEPRQQPPPVAGYASFWEGDDPLADD